MPMEKRYTQHPDNPRHISPAQLKRLSEWIKKYGELSSITVNRRTGHIVSGNQRDEIFNFSKARKTYTVKNEKPDEQGTVAIGHITHNGHRYNFRIVDWDEETEQVAALIANKAGGRWDYEILKKKFDTDMLTNIGFESWEVGTELDIGTHFGYDPDTYQPPQTIISKVILTFTKEQYEEWIDRMHEAGDGTSSEIFIKAAEHYESQKATEQP